MQPSHNLQSDDRYINMNGHVPRMSGVNQVPAQQRWQSGRRGTANQACSLPQHPVAPPQVRQKSPKERRGGHEGGRQQQEELLQCARARLLATAQRMHTPAPASMLVMEGGERTREWRRNGNRMTSKMKTNAEGRALDWCAESVHHGILESPRYKPQRQSIHHFMYAARSVRLASTAIEAFAAPWLQVQRAEPNNTGVRPCRQCAAHNTAGA